MSPSKKGAPAAALPGYAWVYVGVKGDDGRWHLIIKDGGSQVMELLDAVMQVPVTHEAVQVACDKDTIEIESIDGEKWTLTGVDASAVKKYLHYSESCRGLGRRKDKAGKYVATPAEVRDAYAQFTQVAVGERGGFRQKQVSEKETEDLTKAELIELLRSKGMLKAAEE